MTAWYKTFFNEDYWPYARLEYDAARTAAEVEYLAGVLADVAPGRRVVDLGCGTGRHAISLASRGFDVLGLDVSEWALSAAAKDAAAAGVVVDFELTDLIVDPALPVPAGTLHGAYAVQAVGWGSDGAQRRMLENVRRALVPGGALVLDFSSALWMFGHYAEREEKDAHGSHFSFFRAYDAATGRSRTRVEITRDGGTVELRDDLRLYTPVEVIALVRSAGFEVLRLDADFVAGAAVSRDTRYAQVVARAAPVPPQALALTTTGSAEAGEVLDLRWAPDEAAFLDPAPDELWARVASRPAADARRYALDDPYGAAAGAPALAEHFECDVTPGNVVFAAGVSALLRHALELARGGTVAVMPDAFPDGPAWARALGCEVRVFEPAAGALPTGVELVLVERPSLRGRDVLDELAAVAAAAAERGAVVVVDESYGNYLRPDDSAVSFAIGHAENVVVLRGFSKGYCWGGLRAGYAIASPPLATRLREVVPPLQVAATSMDVAVELLRAGDVTASLRTRIAEVKPRVIDALRAAAFEVDATHPELPWVLLTGADDVGASLRARAIAGKSLPSIAAVRMSVPLSDERLTRFTEVLA